MRNINCETISFLFYFSNREVPKLLPSHYLLFANNNKNISQLKKDRLWQWHCKVSGAAVQVCRNTTVLYIIAAFLEESNWTRNHFSFVKSLVGQMPFVWQQRQYIAEKWYHTLKIKLLKIRTKSGQLIVISVMLV